MDPLTASSKNRLKTLGAVAVLIALFVLPILGLRSYSTSIHNAVRVPKVARAECGLVLTGAPGRIREGIALLSQRVFKKLIISGVHQRTTLADVFPEVLFYPEIDLENVILERRSTSTWGNAQQSLPIIEALQCKTVALITSDYHMYRTMRTFHAIFPASISILPYPVSSQRLLKRRQFPFDTRYWGIVFDEWTKYLFYDIAVF